ncbi:MAG: hypothetical protein M1400_01365 [Patescibacteria group bacterium]|nr:hypothetical protein [Patescibacteria group bacterium]
MKLLAKVEENNYFLFLWALCLIFNIITFLFIYYKILPSGNTFALKYNVITGVEWYGKGYNLYQIPLVGLAILSLNYLLSRLLRHRADFLAAMAIFVTLVVQLLLLAAALFLKTVN